MHGCTSIVNVFGILKKKVEMDTLLDNIEIAAQMDIKKLFKGMTLDQGGVGNGNDMLRTSGDTDRPSAKPAASTSGQ